MAEHEIDQPQPPQPQALTVLRSLTGIVDHATVVATAVVANVAVLEGLAPELRNPLVALCDSVYDLDYRTANLVPPPPASQLPLG